MGFAKKDCKFCARLKKGDFVFENNHIVVFFGRPHHKGHMVVTTKRHELDLMRLHPKTLDSYMNDTMLICRALHKAIKFDRLNFEYLDNWDPHIHFNVYPRFKTDPDWGNPPKIPTKKQKFTPKEMTEKEIKIFERELNKIKKKL